MAVDVSVAGMGVFERAGVTVSVGNMGVADSGDGVEVGCPFDWKLQPAMIIEKKISVLRTRRDIMIQHSPYRSTDFANLVGVL